jgi:hypothetical protein
MEHQFVKNNAVYYFIIDQQNKINSKQNPFIRSDDDKVSIYLNGIIYNCSSEGLISGFKSEGPGFCQKA